MLLDLLLYLAIASLMLAGQFARSINSVKRSVGTAQGQYAVQLQSGVNLYMLANITELMKAAPSVGGFVNPLKPTILELRNNKYLPNSFGTVSPFGSTFAVELKASNCPAATPPVTVPPTPPVPCVVAGYAWTTAPFNNDAGSVDMPVLAQARETIGQDGAMSFPGAGAAIRGFNEGYSDVNPAGNVAGILAIRVGTNSGFLSALNMFYRKSGDELAGTMEAKNNDIKDVKDLTAATVTTSGTTKASNLVVTEMAAAGTNCSAAGAQNIRLNASGTGIVVCYNNVWQQVGNVVAGIADGGSCTTANQVGTDATGVTFVCNGSFWSPLAVFANAGDLCTMAGRVAITTTTREQLICRGGRYQSVNSLFPKIVQVARYSVTDGASVPKPTCGPGGTNAWSWSMTQCVLDVGKTPPRQACYVAATEGATTYTVAVRVKDDTGGDFSASYLNVSAIFNTECSY